MPHPSSQRKLECPESGGVGLESGCRARVALRGGGALGNGEQADGELGGMVLKLGKAMSSGGEQPLVRNIPPGPTPAARAVSPGSLLTT